MTSSSNQNEFEFEVPDAVEAGTQPLPDFDTPGEGLGLDEQVLQAQGGELPAAARSPMLTNLFKNKPQGDDESMDFIAPEAALANQSGEDGPDERVLHALKKDLDKHVDMRTLVYDFGPFLQVDRRLQGVSRDAADAEDAPPEVADAYMSHMRQALHDACFTTRGLDAGGTTEVGLKARISALAAAEKAFKEGPAHELTKDLQQAGLGNAGRLMNQMLKGIADERRFLEQLAPQLTPPTLAGLLTRFMTNSNPLDERQATLVGDARRTRNQQLSSALSDLSELSRDIRDNAGNADWERANGPAAAKGCKDLLGRIEELTSDVAEQVDARALRRGLDGVKSDLHVAAESAHSDAHKENLQQLLQNVQDMIADFLKALSRLFSKASTDGAGPDTGRHPAPARP